MWNIIIESGIIAVFLGFATSISSIIITNNANKKHEQQEKKYILIKEIYKRLVLVYKRQLREINIEEIREKSISDLFTDSMIAVYQDCKAMMDDLYISYMEIKYILSEKDIMDLESKFKAIEDIDKMLFNTSFNNKIKGKSGYEDIVINDDIVIIEEAKIPEYVKKYVEEAKILKKHFLNIVEMELRKILS